ncbi:Cytochrome P450 [Mycena kentingensis (nom. inval.)]|nr:Cytochrome P450 [Mycena kentingensis (nom. inval.)]
MRLAYVPGYESAGAQNPLDAVTTCRCGSISPTRIYPPALLPSFATGAMSPSASILLLIAVAVTISLILLQRLGKSRRLPLPPAPRGLPLIGNLLDIPADGFEWETYMAWSRRYNSDILYLDVAGTSIIVLSSAEATADLLEKRSSVYSNRPRFPMVNELMGWSFNFAFMKYGERWRKLRRLFHSDFNAESVTKYHQRQLEACHELLRRVHRAPEGLLDHLRHMAGEVIMSAAYGIEVLAQDDPYIDMAETALKALVHASIPGRFLVDLVPALMHFPEWFPGAGFKKLAKEWRGVVEEMVERPFAQSRKQIECSTHPRPPSFCSTLLPAADPDLVKHAAATMYAAGSDTTVSILGSFVLAMLANPAAQKRAQKEVDRVLGNHLGAQLQLPDFSMYADAETTMPFVCAVSREVLRWRPALPFAPHFVDLEDEYRGMRIPARSLVLANIWAILHDEKTYPNPDVFLPERWLIPTGELNLEMRGWELAFGFGRRVCVGRHFALASIWIAVVSFLSVFDIDIEAGEEGEIPAGGEGCESGIRIGFGHTATAVQVLHKAPLC